jgi:hypothetical protein
MTYKLPPLAVFISKAKKAYDIMAKLGMMKKQDGSTLTWAEHESFCKATYDEMRKMDPRKLQEYIDSKQPRRAAVMLTLDAELEKQTNALTARQRLEKAAEDARRR